MPSVASLHVYPIKSLGGVTLGQSAVTRRGLRHDRRWMLVDEDGVFLSQRSISRMALFRQVITPAGLRVQGPSGATLEIPIDAERERVEVQVWKSEVEAVRVSDEADAWFSSEMGRPARLVYMPEDSVRPTHPDFTQPGDLVGFADAFPVLVISQASLDDLNRRLEEPIPMNRFRPNVVLDGCAPYEEDHWSGFTLNGIHFRHAKTCGRCQVTATSQETGSVGKEPLRTLATYRKEGSVVYFGCYYVPETEGEACVGDELEIASAADGTA